MVPSLFAFAIEKKNMWSLALHSVQESKRYTASKV